MIRCLICNEDITAHENYYVHKRPHFNEGDLANICLVCVDKLIEDKDE